MGRRLDRSGSMRKHDVAAVDHPGCCRPPDRDSTCPERTGVAREYFHSFRRLARRHGVKSRSGPSLLGVATCGQARARRDSCLINRHLVHRSMAVGVGLVHGARPSIPLRFLRSMSSRNGPTKRNASRRFNRLANPCPPAPRTDRQQGTSARCRRPRSRPYGLRQVLSPVEERRARSSHSTYP